MINVYYIAAVAALFGLLFLVSRLLRFGPVTVLWRAITNLFLVFAAFAAFADTNYKPSVAPLFSLIATGLAVLVLAGLFEEASYYFKDRQKSLKLLGLLFKAAGLAFLLAYTVRNRTLLPATWWIALLITVVVILCTAGFRKNLPSYILSIAIVAITAFFAVNSFQVILKDPMYTGITDFICGAMLFISSVILVDYKGNAGNTSFLSTLGTLGLYIGMFTVIIGITLI